MFLRGHVSIDLGQFRYTIGSTSQLTQPEDTQWLRREFGGILAVHVARILRTIRAREADGRRTGQ